MTAYYENSLKVYDDAIRDYRSRTSAREISKLEIALVSSILGHPVSTFDKDNHEVNPQIAGPNLEVLDKFMRCSCYAR
jgi:hypothetical protein